MTLEHSLSGYDLEALGGSLRDANAAFTAWYPGDHGARQPVHTVYGGAQLFRADTAGRLGQLALAAFRDYAPDAAALAAAAGITDETLASTVHTRVAAKLEREAVEDFRIDFEDGYGVRPDEEEDSQAVAVAREIARGISAGSLPPFIGIRVKPVSEELRPRSTRTLDLVTTTLVRETGGALPENFVITLPKITIAWQVEYFAGVLALLEERLGLAAGTLRFEIMVETPQAVIDAGGSSPLARFIDAGRGRITAAHFGTYDYTALLGITASQQRMQHPACDFAKHVMQVSLSGTGVWISDGSTTVLPVPPHRAAEGGSLTKQQQAENRAVVHGAWRLHYDDVLHSLRGGFYQGWDLHPAQIVTRYAALYSFFLTGVEAAGARLRNFLDKAAQATLVGDVFDDAATGQGLLNFFLRGINSGALTEKEVMELSGVTLDELSGRSFTRILAGRRGSAGEAADGTVATSA
ncbi:aldolase/citrate lyase family protein [soil metagenome]